MFVAEGAYVRVSVLQFEFGNVPLPPLRSGLSAAERKRERVGEIGGVAVASSGTRRHKTPNDMVLSANVGCPRDWHIACCLP